MNIINVSIMNKKAVRTNETAYVCDNSDFTVVFSFDEEWDAFPTKTARFVYNDKYQDVVFTGTECPMPKISNTKLISVGVFAGDLHTTTPAKIVSNKSILGASGVPDTPSPDVYAQIMELIKNTGGGGGSITVDTVLDAFSDNPIANSAITRYVETQLPSKSDVNAFADGDRIAKRAECDKNGNQIDTTYATNKNVNELVENISKVLEGIECTINKMYLIPDETEHDNEWYPSNGAVRKYVTAQIGDVETSLDNIIKKYGLGGDSV